MFYLGKYFFRAATGIRPFTGGFELNMVGSVIGAPRERSLRKLYSER